MSKSANVKSGVWEHFVRDSVGQTAQCQLCKSQLKIAGGSTRSMLSIHLRSKHKINLLKHKDVGDPCRSDEAKDGRPPSPSTSTGRDGSHAASTSVSSGSAKLGYRVTNVTMTNISSESK